jgi:peptidoglycan-associated lipoprotein
MTRRLLVWIAVLALSVALPACRPKKPATPTDDLSGSTVTTPTAPATDVNPSARPATSDTQPDPLAGDIAAANEHAYATGLLGDVYFDFDKSDLTEASRGRLARNAEFLRSHPEFQLSIEGHCDERGTNEYNLALGERRAAAAKDYLVSLGVAGGRLRTVSYGEERPQCTTSDESCWGLNRRAHFLITGRGGVG